MVGGVLGIFLIPMYKMKNHHVGIVQDIFIFKKSARRFGETINTLADQRVVRDM